MNRTIIGEGASRRAGAVRSPITRARAAARPTSTTCSVSVIWSPRRSTSIDKVIAGTGLVLVGLVEAALGRQPKRYLERLDGGNQGGCLGRYRPCSDRARVKTRFTGRKSSGVIEPVQSSPKTWSRSPTIRPSHVPPYYRESPCSSRAWLQDDGDRSETDRLLRPLFVHRGSRYAADLYPGDVAETIR